MTCKDCIYHSRCEKIHNPNNEYNFMMYYGNAHAELECEDFKDKSLFMELPYKVGDVYYTIDRFWSEVVQCVITNISYSLNKRWEVKSNIRLCEVYDGYTIDNQYNFGFDDIGIKFFLTQEEAEKALERMK